MAMDGIPDMIIKFITSITTNRYIIIAMIIVLLTLVGCVLDMASATLIFLPVLFPLIQMIGMDPVHFGIVFSLMITIGMITPPVGQCLFITTNITKTPFMDICKRIGLFVIVAIGTTTALAYLPDVVLIIPQLMGYTGT